jgi:hypothetical protein
MVYGGEDDISTFHAALHERNEYCHTYYDSGTDTAVLHDFFVSFFLSNFFWYFSIHIVIDFIFVSFRSKLTFYTTKTVPET